MSDPGHPSSSFPAAASTTQESHSTEAPPLLEREERFLGMAVDALTIAIKIGLHDQLNAKYDQLMPNLKRMLIEIPDHRKDLFATSVESIATLAEAADREKFEKDFREVSAAVECRMATLPPSHPTFCRLMEAACTMIDMMGSRCETLVRVISDACLRALTCPIEDARSLKWMAGGIIGDWASSSYKDSVAPLAEKFSDAMLPLLSPNHSPSDLTLAVAGTLPKLLGCLAPEKRRTVWKKQWKTLQQGIKEDLRREVVTNYLTVADNSCKILGAKGVSANDAKELGLIIRGELEQEELRRRAQPNASYDLLTALAMLVLTAFRVKRKAFCQVFTTFFPLVSSLINSTSDKWWAVLILDAILNYAPSIASTHVHFLVMHFAGALNDADSKVRLFGTKAFHDMATMSIDWKRISAGSIDALAAMISRPDARTEQFNSASEDAIVSIVHILTKCEALIGKKKFDYMTRRLIDWLPLTGLVLGGERVYEFLANVIETRKFILLGETFEKYPRILEILVKAVHRGLFYRSAESVRVKERLAKCIKSIGAEEGFDSWVENARLNESEWTALRRILTSPI